MRVTLIKFSSSKAATLKKLQGDKGLSSGIPKKNEAHLDSEINLTKKASLLKLIVKVLDTFIENNSFSGQLKLQQLMNCFH